MALEQNILHRVCAWCIASKILFLEKIGWTIPRRKQAMTDTEFLVFLQSNGFNIPISKGVIVYKKLRKELSPEGYEERREAKKSAMESALPRYGTTTEFVRAQLTKISVEIAAGGTFIGPDADNAEGKIKVLMEEYNSKITKEMAEIGYHKFSDRVVGDVLKIYAKEKDGEFKSELRELLAHDPLVDPEYDLITDWTDAVRNPQSPTREVDIAVVKHMIWQVKRRFYGKRADPILCLFLHGVQNCGKSTALRMLFEPIARYTFEADINNAIDNRWNFLAQSYFVLNVEELLGMAKADIEKLKSFVTKDKQVTRILGGHNTAITQQNLSIFGSTNRGIASLIGDETGMRRWYQIIGPLNTGERMNFALLNQLDFVDMWRSIDENMEKSPLFSDLALTAQLFALQESWRKKTETEEWLLSQGMWPLEDGCGILKIDLEQIMIRLTAYCETNAMHCPDRRRVRHHLDDLQVRKEGKDYLLRNPTGARASTYTQDDVMAMFAPMPGEVN